MDMSKPEKLGLSKTEEKNLTNDGMHCDDCKLVLGLVMLVEHGLVD